MINLIGIDSLGLTAAPAIGMMVTVMLKEQGLPVESIQSVKFRTRAGMRQCQGAYCRSRVKELINRELKIP